MAMATGLRTQILFWSFHGRAEMRGSMPGPARIVEYGSRESDKIGVASSNNRLSLIIACDETDRDGRQVRCSLDGASERDLIARPTGIFCAGVIPPLETCMALQPRAASAFAKAMVCSRSQPPSAQSVPDTRMLTGRSTGKTVWTASNTSRGKRIRFSRLPP